MVVEEENGRLTSEGTILEKSPHERQKSILRHHSGRQKAQSLRVEKKVIADDKNACLEWVRGKVLDLVNLG